MCINRTNEPRPALAAQHRRCGCIRQLSAFADHVPNGDENEHCGTHPPFADAAIADAAFPRTCDRLFAAMPSLSSKRSFTGVNFCSNRNRTFAAARSDENDAGPSEFFAEAAPMAACSGLCTFVGRKSCLFQTPSNSFCVSACSYRSFDCRRRSVENDGDHCVAFIVSRTNIASC